MTKAAYLISKEEGFYAPGSLPARMHNPGDLRHSPHSTHPGDLNAVGDIDNDADGFFDEERQLQIFAARGFTLKQTIYEWAPPNENNSAKYLADIIDGFGGIIDENTPLSQVLLIQA